MKLKIGIAGSHRTGKTTLAHELTKVFPQLKFINSSLSSHPVWSYYNKSPDVVLSFEERILIQTELIKYIADIISSNQKIEFVIDRTTIDTLAYLYCNVDSSVTKKFNYQVDQLKKIVIESMTDLNVIIFLYPGIENVVEETNLFFSGKNNLTFESLVYRDALTHSMLGIINRYNKFAKVIIIPENVLDLEERIDYILYPGGLCDV